MAGIRDKLIHDYININPEVVWRTVTEDLPIVLPQLEQMLIGERGEQRSDAGDPDNSGAARA
jgi:uncharacterized protein with HEPN domain